MARARVDARQADNDRAQADLARMKPLAQKQEISQLQFDSDAAQLVLGRLAPLAVVELRGHGRVCLGERAERDQARVPRQG